MGCRSLSGFISSHCGFGDTTENTALLWGKNGAAYLTLLSTEGTLLGLEIGMQAMKSYQIRDGLKKPNPNKHSPPPSKNQTHPKQPQNKQNPPKTNNKKNPEAAKKNTKTQPQTSGIQLNKRGRVQLCTITVAHLHYPTRSPSP